MDREEGEMSEDEMFVDDVVKPEPISETNSTMVCSFLLDSHCCIHVNGIFVYLSEQYNI